MQVGEANHHCAQLIKPVNEGISIIVYESNVQYTMPHNLSEKIGCFIFYCIHERSYLHKFYCINSSLSVTVTGSCNAGFNLD